MKMLLCSDGSEQAQRAVRLGAWIAGRCRAEVTLLGIVEDLHSSDRILASLRKAQESLNHDHIPAELITKAGEPVEEIRRRAEETAYDLVIIGAVRKTNRGMFWLSSKAYRIIREIRPPVLSVAGNTEAISRILICSGGKGYIDNAVRLTGEFARCIGATIILLHVMPDPPAIYSGLPRMEQTPARLLDSPSELGRNLRREKETLEALGLTTELQLGHGAVLDEILRAVHQGNYDLVVTGTALSQGLRSYVLGDISREILNRVSRPVLVVRSAEVAGAARSSFRAWWAG
jgi:nucleotide-binding universal stress UspA family protein